jgi:ribosome-associated protein
LSLARVHAIDFELDREFVELNQLLKLAGLCDSGGAGKQLVASGAVRVDGAVELRKTAKVRAGQRVRVGEVEIRVVGA